jgi:hypothetical protein
MTSGFAAAQQHCIVQARATMRVVTAVHLPNAEVLPSGSWCGVSTVLISR